MAGMGSLGRGVGWSGDWRHGRGAGRDQTTSGGTKRVQEPEGLKVKVGQCDILLELHPSLPSHNLVMGGLMERELRPTFTWMREGGKEKRRAQGAELGTSE